MSERPIETGRSTPLPLYIDMSGKQTLVVGGGCVAQRKVETLVAHRCDVRVVATKASEKLKALAARSEIELCEREFEDQDVEGCFLVFACTDSCGMNERIEKRAHNAGALVNRVDAETPEVSVPASLNRGNLQIAVSTGGCSPALAGRIRRDLEERYDESYAEYVALLGKARRSILDEVADSKLRHALNAELATQRYLDAIRENPEITAEELIELAWASAEERR